MWKKKNDLFSNRVNHANPAHSFPKCCLISRRIWVRQWYTRKGNSMQRKQVISNFYRDLSREHHIIAVLILERWYFCSKSIIDPKLKGKKWWRAGAHHLKIELIWPEARRHPVELFWCQTAADVLNIMHRVLLTPIFSCTRWSSWATKRKILEQQALCEVTHYARYPYENNKCRIAGARDMMCSVWSCENKKTFHFFTAAPATDARAFLSILAQGFFPCWL
jgi:hypothetical protein